MHSNASFTHDSQLHWFITSRVSPLFTPHRWIQRTWHHTPTHQSNTSTEDTNLEWTIRIRCGRNIELIMLSSLTVHQMPCLISCSSSVFVFRWTQTFPLSCWCAAHVIWMGDGCSWGPRIWLAGCHVSCGKEVSCRGCKGGISCYVMSCVCVKELLLYCVLMYVPSFISMAMNINMTSAEQSKKGASNICWTLDLCVHAHEFIESHIDIDALILISGDWLILVSGDYTCIQQGRPRDLLFHFISPIRWKHDIQKSRCVLHMFVCMSISMSVCVIVCPHVAVWMYLRICIHYHHTTSSLYLHIHRILHLGLHLGGACKHLPCTWHHVLERYVIAMSTFVILVIAVILFDNLFPSFCLFAFTATVIFSLHFPS